MKFALVNPAWDFEGSIYFGCREPHLPLEFGYSKALIEQAGHQAFIVDAQLEGLLHRELVESVGRLGVDAVVVTTAPSYLFWRCAPPELRIPQRVCKDLRACAEHLIVVGPHASTTPRATLQKTGADLVILGECEEVLPRLTQDWSTLQSVAYWENGQFISRGANCAADMKALPALRWPTDYVRKHHHHHHRFDAPPLGPGAEMEASRGCPYHCTFCAKDNFRNSYRKRPLDRILQELDNLLSQGVEYVYFIDEIFLPDLPLLDALAERRVKLGVQTRIDLWNGQAIESLAKAGCVSIEAGVESITEAGRALLDKRCKLSTQELTDRLVFAKTMVPFVQANLLAMAEDEVDSVEEWRSALERKGVWANKPVPLFPYPGSPEYTRRWGKVDDFAWERAHEAYLGGFNSFSDVQASNPHGLVELEIRP